jgi:hypothetical protein
VAPKAKGKGLDPEEIAGRNPTIDIEQYREVTRLLDNLREHGVVPRDYDLRSPYDPRALEHSPRTHSPLKIDAEIDEASPRT